MEDALKKLDKLTQEEARMAVAQNLRVTYTVDERVRGIGSTVIAIDNRVSSVDDRIAGVDDRIAGIDDRVAWAADVSVVKQTANDVDQVKRLSSLTSSVLILEP